MFGVEDNIGKKFKVINFGVVREVSSCLLIGELSVFILDFIILFWL